MQLYTNLITLFIGFGVIIFIILQNKMYLELENLVLLLVLLIILLPPIRLSSSIPMIRFEEILFLYYNFNYKDTFELTKLIKFILILLIVSNIKFDDKFYRNFIKIFIISIACSALVGILQHSNIFNINNTISPLYTTSQLGNIDRL